VGYGDLFPTGPLGKISGALCAVFGIVVLAMPVGVIGNNFSEEADKQLKEREMRENATKMEAHLKRALQAGKASFSRKPSGTPQLGSSSIGGQVAGGQAQCHGTTRPSSRPSSAEVRVPKVPVKPCSVSGSVTSSKPSSASGPCASSSRTAANVARPRRPSSAKEIAKWGTSSTAQMARLHTIAQWWLAVLSRPPPEGGPAHLWLPRHKRQKTVARLQRFLCAPQLSDCGVKGSPDAFENWQRDAAKLSESLRLWLLDSMAEQWVGCHGEAGMRHALQEETLNLEVATTLMRLFQAVVHMQPKEEALALE